MRLFALALATVAAGCTALGTSSVRGYWPASAGVAGDVDGNGTRDRVYVARAEDDPCDLLLVVTGDRHYSSAFTVECEKPSEVEAAPPFVDALVEIDGRPGLEIVVELGHGATRVFVRLFTIRGGRLRPVGGELEYGGSVGTGDTFLDCGRTAGEIVVTNRAFVEERLTVTRFRVDGTRLTPIGSTTSLLRAEDGPPGPQPFPSCTGRRS